MLVSIYGTINQQKQHRAIYLKSSKRISNFQSNLQLNDYFYRVNICQNVIFLSIYLSIYPH